MILVIPFTGPSDYFTQLTSALKERGGLGPHRLLVVSDTVNLSEANAFVDGLKDQFMFTSIVSTKTAGAPLVRLFRDGLVAAAATVFTQQEAPNAPICWLPPGFLPTKQEWLTALSMEFFNRGGGQKTMAAWTKRPDVLVGNGVARHRVEDGYAPTSAVVFPNAFVRGNEMITRINDASTDWKHRIRYLVVPIMLDTPLLGDGPEAVVTGAPQSPSKKTQPAPVEEPQPAAEEKPKLRAASLKSNIPVPTPVAAE